MSNDCLLSLHVLTTQQCEEFETNNLNKLIYVYTMSFLEVYGDDINVL